MKTKIYIYLLIDKFYKMNFLQKISFAIILMVSNIAFSQAKGKEYGILEKGKAVEISHRRNSDNSIDFLYRKSEPGSYTVYYSFSNVRNTSFSDGVKKVIVKNNSGTLFKLRASDPKKRILYKSSYNVQRGITDPKFNEDFVYLLPYPKKTSVKLLNAKKVDSFAIEVLEKTDKITYKFQSTTPDVYVSRKGEVIDILNAIGKRTQIKIEHTDGTIAVYSGFDNSTIKVKKGQKVLPGKLLGNSEKDKDELFTLYFKVIYKTRVDNKNKTAYILPNFSTLKGVINLTKNKTYTSDYNDDVFLKEFTRKEKKKYLKEKA